MCGTEAELHQGGREAPQTLLEEAYEAQSSLEDPPAFLFGRL